MRNTLLIVCFTTYNRYSMIGPHVGLVFLRFNSAVVTKFEIFKDPTFVEYLNFLEPPN